MPNVVIKIEPGHINMTGTAFMVYANRYREATLAWLPTSRRTDRFDPVSYHLLCLSLELYLKSYIWLHDQIGHQKLKKKYGHDIEKLWHHSKVRGISKYARVTPLRDRVISLVGPYYFNRQFNYLDLDMVFSGFKNLKSEPKAIPTLSRLTGQLGKSLRTPILRAS